MNGRVLLGGVAAGIVMSVLNYVLHGMVLGGTYAERPDVFSQEQANPLLFTGIAVLLGVVLAYLYGKSMGSWGGGLFGGVCAGLVAGSLVGFTNFYWPLVFEGFPYFLSWCWLGVDLISYGVGGAVLALIVKPSTP